MTLLTPKSTLFPYTTLFRSVIELYKKDYQDAKKIEADDDKLIKISGDNSIEKQILQNENLRPLTFLRIPTTLIEEAKIIFQEDRKSTRLNSSHVRISYAVFC